MESEDEATDQIQSFTKWLDSIWEKNSKLGKLFILTIFVAIASPFIVAVISVIIVWFWIVPYATTVTDKVFAFGVLFSLLNRSLVEDRQFCQSDANQFVSNKEAKTVKELGNGCTLLPVQIMSSRTRLPTSQRSEA